MEELVITRSNPLVDPHLAIWGWEVALYLFLGGLTAGVMILTALLARPADDQGVSRCMRLLPFAAPVLISIGMLLLFLDLEFKSHVLRFYLFFRITSPMSWGAWILVAIYPATLLLGMAGISDDAWSRIVPKTVQRVLGPVRDVGIRRFEGLRFANVVLGVGLGVYTGLLLGTLAARPLWNSAILGPLFLVSGLSSAAAFLGLFPVSSDEHVRLGRWDASAMIVELCLIALFLIGLVTSSGASRSAAGLLLGGPYTAPFWSLVVLLGLVLPLLLNGVAWMKRSSPSYLVPILVLTGSLALRWILISAGQAI